MAQVVGLDIGTSAVRAAELDLGASPPILVTYGQVGLPSGAIVDGEVRDVSAVSDAIRRLWHNGNFVSTSVLVGLAGLRAITREMDMPFVPDDEVDSAAKFQAEEVIPFPPEKTLLSARVLADFTGEDGAPMRRVLVAAAHRDLVDGVVAAIEGAELTVEGIDLVSSALVRAIADPAYMTEQPEAIVSIGAGLTVVAVHQQGRPQFVRTIGTGGTAITEAISSALDLPLADAEAVKRRLGEPSPQIQAAEQPARAAMQELVGEIRNSVHYFASLPGREPIGRILITGGGSRLRGFVEELQAETNLPVFPVSTLARLNTSALRLSPEQAAQIDPVLSTPIGLALPDPNASVKRFNLVPPEVAQHAAERRMVRITTLVAAVIVILLLAASVLRLVQVHSAQDSLKSLQANIATLDAEQPRYDKALAVQDELNRSKTLLQSVTSRAVDWSTTIKHLQSLAPSGLSLSGFSGTTTAPPATTSGTSSTTTTMAPSTTSVSSDIGSFTGACSGPSVGDTLAAKWEDDLSVPQSEALTSAAASWPFDNVNIGEITNTGGNSSFTCSAGITSALSMAHDKAYQG
jgi:type IV pilus assembly protein PilM